MGVAPGQVVLTNLETSGQFTVNRVGDFDMALYPKVRDTPGPTLFVVRQCFG